MKLVLMLMLILCSACTLIDKNKKYETASQDVLTKEIVNDTKKTTYFLGDIQYIDSDVVIPSLLENGITTITVPISWSEVEVEEGQFSFDMYANILDKYKDKGFDFIFVLDTTGRFLLNQNNEYILDNQGENRTSIPSYILTKFEDERMVNFQNEKMSDLDYMYGEHTEYIYRFYDKTLAFLKNNYRENIEAISTGIMTEFEIKLPQKDYKWTPYSDKNKTEFIDYMKKKYETIDTLNDKLGTSFTEFSDLYLPIINYNNSVVNSTIKDDALFVDFMNFREDMVINYVTPLTEKIKEYGFETIGYFGQFYHPNDGIYASNLIGKCSDLYDIAVVDYNFYDGYNSVFNDMVPVFLTNYAKNLGFKKVYTGIYVERIDYENNLDFLQSCLDNISNDGNSDGIEIGNVRPIENLEKLSFDLYKTSNVNKGNKIGLYFSKWNTYKTHGEPKETVNYLTDSLTNMLNIVENKLGYSVDVISAEKVLSDISEYEIIIIPSQIIVSEEERQKLIDYKNSGGKLLIDYRFSEFNEYGQAISITDLFQEVEAIQAENTNAEIKEKTILDSKISIPKNKTNLPNFYKMLVSENSNLLDSSEGNIGIKGKNVIIMGFQPQNLYKSTGNDTYVEFIDYCVKELLKSDN